MYTIANANLAEHLISVHCTVCKYTSFKKYKICKYILEVAKMSILKVSISQLDPHLRNLWWSDHSKTSFYKIWEHLPISGQKLHLRESESYILKVNRTKDHICSTSWTRNPEKYMTHQEHFLSYYWPLQCL